MSAHLRNVYGIDASIEMILYMTDSILSIATEWQNRLLERKYTKSSRDISNALYLLKINVQY